MCKSCICQLIFLFDFRIHFPSESLFSTGSGYNNYRGVLNLCIVLLVLTTSRVALENLIKYGILIDPVSWVTIFVADPYNWPCVILIACSNIFILASFQLEILLLKGWLSEIVGRWMHVINCVAILVFPASVVLTTYVSLPAGASYALFVYTCVFLKTVSYIATNHWLRYQYKSSGQRKAGRRKPTKSVGDEQNLANGKLETQLVTYPDNLTLQDLYSFMLFPTLCYELNFPRTPRIRKRFLLKRLAEMVDLNMLFFCIIHQWIAPLLHNAIKPFVDMDLPMMVERIMKLAIPNHFIWLIFFYWFFHSNLNVLAEITQFADRTFYRDWWNSESVPYFWSNWNIPVYRWCKRHLYQPLMRRGYSKLLGQICVFATSAFFHEYLVSVPLRMFRWWAFMGMLMQVPFAVFVSKFLTGPYGNMAVWVSLIVGQPFAILMYLHDYYVINHLQPPVGQNITNAGL
uniref:O-acyltransferase n=1 Tax=Branchiostoma floridae TaxID=7739 RepID=C3XU07_BRAFL|eukprot:XP_002612372.1 hypothetical protein BRAFLDRAFT_280106 [Branchiostoma floridae]